MLVCSGGHENVPTARFCVKCGEPLPATPFDPHPRTMQPVQGVSLREGTQSTRTDSSSSSGGTPWIKLSAIGAVALLAVAVLVLAFQLSRVSSDGETSQGPWGGTGSLDVEGADPSSPAGSDGSPETSGTSAGGPGGADKPWSQVRVVDEIRVSDVTGDTSKEMALSPDGKTAYVALEEAGAVSVVDLEKREVRQLVFVGEEPQGVAVSPDGSRIYVAVYSTSEIVTIDSASLEEVSRVKIGDEWEAFNVAVSPDGSTLYVTRGFEPGVVKLDARTGADLGLISTSDMGDSSGVAVTPDGQRLYVSDDQWVYIFDLSSGSLERRFRLTEVERMKFTSDGRFLLMSFFSSERPGILVMDPTSDQEVGVILPDIDYVRGFAVTDDFRSVYASARGLVIAER